MTRSQPLSLTGPIEMSAPHLTAKYWLQATADLANAPFETQVGALGLANAALGSPELSLIGRLAVYQAVRAIVATHPDRAARYVIDSGVAIDWTPLLTDAHIVYSFRHYTSENLFRDLIASRRG